MSGLNKGKLSEIPLSRARLTKLESKVSSLPNYPEKVIFQREIEKAKKNLDNNNSDYANALWKEVRHTIHRLRIRSFLIPNPGNSNIQFILLGIVIYSIILFLIGICTIIVYNYNFKPEPWLIKFVKIIGLDPLFKTVIGFGINPTSYLWGLLGGSGAVVSIVKRFDIIANKKASTWFFFSQGLFNPIVGSFSAIIICKFISAGLLPEYKGIPLIIISFFAGFTERLLSKIGSSFQGKD